MRAYFIFFYFSFSFLSSLKIYYLTPFDVTNACPPSGTKTCSGTLLAPYDNLQYAFKAAINYGNSTGDKTMIFNLISNVDAPFPLYSDKTSISPFEYFNGIFCKNNKKINKISLRKIKVN